MSIETILYLIDVLKSIKDITCFLSWAPLALLLIIAFFSLMRIAHDDVEYEDSLLFKYIKIIIKSAGWWLLACIIYIFIPSEKTMYMMIGANYLKSTTIPSKVELVIEKKLDEYLVDDKDKS